MSRDDVVREMREHASEVFFSTLNDWADRLQEQGEAVAWASPEVMASLTEKVPTHVTKVEEVFSRQRHSMDTPLYAHPAPAPVVTDEEAIRNVKLLYGFMLECGIIGAKEAGVNLAHSIKEYTAALQSKDRTDLNELSGNSGQLKLAERELAKATPGSVAE
jgi:hypothetical protein